MFAIYGCEHGRDCVKCPDIHLNKAMELMKEAANLYSLVLEGYNGITVKTIVTFGGIVKAKLEVMEDDNF